MLNPGNYKLKKQYRLTHHDYSSPGAYFVTICTKNRDEFFGEVRNGILGLNDIGCVAAKFWQEIPNHFKMLNWEPGKSCRTICMGLLKLWKQLILD